ncbi:hypothetical protein R3P38DRAFT_99698 [Favolaschia claudopus]|uniref:Uncharacterized protein n=1 Tax=Favolaschia claudopus TaxID=2862362 RepID=A0AAV9ZY47_9AGAR
MIDSDDTYSPCSTPLSPSSVLFLSPLSLLSFPYLSLLVSSFYFHCLYLQYPFRSSLLARVFPRTHSSSNRYAWASSSPALSFSTPSCPHGRIFTPRYLLDFLPLSLDPLPPPSSTPPPRRGPPTRSLPHVFSRSDRYLRLSSHSLLLVSSSTIPPTRRTQSLMTPKADNVLVPDPCSTAAVDADTASVGVRVDMGGGIGGG